MRGSAAGSASRGDAYVGGAATGIDGTGTPVIVCDGCYSAGPGREAPAIYTDPGHFPGATYYYVKVTKIAEHYHSVILDSNGVDITGANSLDDLMSYDSSTKTFGFSFNSSALIDHYFDDATGVFRRDDGDSSVVVNFGEAPLIDPPGPDGVAAISFNNAGNSIDPSHDHQHSVSRARANPDGSIPRCGRAEGCCFATGHSNRANGIAWIAHDLQKFGHIERDARGCERSGPDLSHARRIGAPVEPVGDRMHDLPARLQERGRPVLRVRPGLHSLPPSLPPRRGGAAMKPWIDATVPLRDGMVHWPGDHAVEIERTSDMERGDEVNLTTIRMSAHTGTHMDAPLHFVRGGLGIDRFPLDAVIGPARVIGCTGATSIGARPSSGPTDPQGREPPLPDRELRPRLALPAVPARTTSRSRPMARDSSRSAAYA